MLANKIKLKEWKQYVAHNHAVSKLNKPKLAV